MNKVPDPVALAKELETSDLRVITKEEVENYVATGLVKLCGQDKLFLVHLSMTKSPYFEVKSFSGDRTILATEDLQAALDAYNQAPPSVTPS